MSQRNARLCRGDFVEVKTPDEIVRDADAAGRSIGPPAVHAGNARILWAKISVSRRALTLCFSGPGSSRGFRTDNVVTLTTSAVLAPPTIVVRKGA